MELNGCHESMCSGLTLRKNGEFDLLYSTQTVSYNISGFYEVDGNRIKLYTRSTRNSSHEYLKLGRLKPLKEIYCISIDSNEHMGFLKIKK